MQRTAASLSKSLGWLLHSAAYPDAEIRGIGLTLPRWAKFCYCKSDSRRRFKGSMLIKSLRTTVVISSVICALVSVVAASTSVVYLAAPMTVATGYPGTVVLSSTASNFQAGLVFIVAGTLLALAAIVLYLLSKRVPVK